MTVYYTKDGCYPRGLPDMIVVEENGYEAIRTNPETFTDQEIADAGWVAAPVMPTYNPDTHRIEWNSETNSWYLDEISAEELAERITMAWQGVRSERDDMLSCTDYMVVKATETGTPIPSAWSEYRQGLRDITTQSDPFDITWPTEPE